MSTQDTVETRTRGRQLGPVVAAVALVAMLLVLVWLSGPPAGVAGPVADAPFTLDPRLVTQPDDDGCVDVVDGDGTVVTHCVDLGGERRAHTARFTVDGDLAVGTWDHLLVIDPVTGAVLGTTSEGDLEERRHEGGEVAEPTPVDRLDGPRGPDGDASFTATDGSRVVRYDGSSDDDPEVLLDLDGPPGYRIQGAELSPDGQLLVVVDRERVLVAEVGADEAYVWLELDDDWVDLWNGVDWG